MKEKEMHYKTLVRIVIATGIIGLGACVLMARPSHGATQWARTMTATSRYVAASSATADSAGNSYVAVTYAGTVNFGAGPVSAVTNATDAAVVSYAPDGALRWVSKITGVEWQTLYGIAAGDDGYVYITGSYAGTMTLANTVSALGPGDTFVAKLHAASGAPVWVRSYGSTHDESGRAIAYRNGRICVAGVLYGSHSVGGAVLSPQSVDGWVACYSAAEGQHLWSRTIGGVGADNALGIAMDAASSVYVGGRFNGSLTVGSHVLTSAGRTDAYVLKLHADGTPLWLVSPLPGHVGDDTVNAIAVEGGRVAVTGWTQPATGPTAIWMSQLTTGGALEHVGEWGSTVPGTSSSSNAVAINGTTATLIGFASAPIDFGGGAIDGPYTNDVVTASYDGSLYVGSSRTVAPGAQAGMAIAYTGSGVIQVANDGNNVVVTLVGDSPPPTQPPVSTPTATVPAATATAQHTATRTRTPTTAVPTATAGLPTATPETDLPVCVIGNAPCKLLVEPSPTPTVEMQP